MKQLPHACCMLILALGAASCSSLSTVDAQLRALDLGADTYIVRAGDTLETIAFRYRLSPDQLASMNPGKGRYFPVGTRVNVRPPRNQIAGYQTQQDDLRVSERVRTANDGVITTPVYTPRPVTKTEYEQPTDTTRYAPAVNAVVTDLALLNPSPSDHGTPLMRKGVLQQDDYPYEEEVDAFVARDSAPAPSQWNSDGWTWPTQGQIARGFSPIKEGRHGIDIAGLPGQPVVAVKDGTVAYSGRDPSGTGNLIIVRHGDSLLTAYSHTQDLYVAENDTVRAGDPIATLGWNARQESVLRFEVRQDGNSLNPMDFLASQ